jgi:hypothetical protein
MPKPPYDRKHRAERERHRPSVERGEWDCQEVICLMPSRWIEPGMAWDLAHDRSIPGAYLGPAHEKCNRTEGAIARQQGPVSRWVL